MSFSVYKHGIKRDTTTPTGDAGLAINDDLTAIADLFDTTLFADNNLSDVADAPTALTNLGALSIANNLSDVADPSTSITNLGALKASNNLSDIGDATTTLTNLGALKASNNLSDLSDASAALTNLGIGGGFSGSGTYTNFTISNGIITSAS